MIKEDDADRKMYSSIVEKWMTENKFNVEDLKLKDDELRALACMMGCAIGDALGASTEFEHYDKHREYWIPNDFKDLEKQIENRVLGERHG